MAGTETLDRSTWETALNQLTDEHEGEFVTIEVLDPEVGHQYEANRLPFTTISYDPKDDVVAVSVGGRSPRYPVVLRHLVWHPTEIDVATQDVPEPAVRAVDKDGTATLITFFPQESGTES
ncbi:DUF5335 family protein [Streptomyces recifensis]|jgi:hypothetical protein|uniref:DUF5335 family protein n=1 Tax=Streptomyces recifensis TaxID=67355 RepID=UPI00142DE690|nr:DUF5335 family protein [Streptomyces recifensis]